MAVEVREHEHVVVEAAPPPRVGRRRWTAGGWLRVLWVLPLSFGLATGIVMGARQGFGYHPLWDLQVLITAWLVIVPLGFLVASAKKGTP